MITRQDVVKAMSKVHTVLKDVPVYIPYYSAADMYYRQCVVQDDNEVVEWEAFEECFLLLAKAHPSAKDCENAIWLCDLIYSASGFGDYTGRYYPVDVFKVHPKQLLQQRG